MASPIFNITRKPDDNFYSTLFQLITQMVVLNCRSILQIDPTIYKIVVQLDPAIYKIVVQLDPAIYKIVVQHRNDVSYCQL